MRRIAVAASLGITAGLVCLVFWLGLARTRPPPEPPEADTATAGRQFETLPCWFEIPTGRSARCGAVVDGAGAAAITTRFVVIGAETGGTADPVVYINGGPGSAVGIDAAGIGRWWEITRSVGWLKARDVVLFDQRGVGVSTPSLDCPELSMAGGRIFLQPLGLDDAASLWRAAALDCRQRLVQAGIRLDAFNTAGIVADLTVLLDGLGYPRWNLYGVSYGTRVALEFLRSGDNRIRSVILDSVYPPDSPAYAEAGTNAKQAFDALIGRCAADQHCNAAAPQLATLWTRVLDKAAHGGFDVPITGGDGSREVAHIDQAKLVEILFYGFYRWDTIRQMPQVIAALSRGDVTSLAPFATEAFATAASPSSGYGAFLSVECHDEYPFENADAVKSDAAGLGAFRDFVLTDLPLVVCPSWPVGMAADTSRMPVRSAVPVLLLAGGLDPITPPTWARHAAETLDHGSVFVFPGVGHGVAAAHECAARLLAKFLASPDEKPFEECLLGLG